jgi:methylthioribose-1-phosphate isomerase
VWIEPGDERVSIVDQTLLPFAFEVVRLATVDEVAEAIATMRIRGAGAIGAAAGYGMVLAARAAEGRDEAGYRAALEEAAATLTATRPTAVNLRWAVERQLGALAAVDAPGGRAARALEVATAIADEDVAGCLAIGRFGLPVLREVHERTRRIVNVLTHCNAGWLAFVDVGTATAPIYAAHDAGIPVHVWVDETRPRNQGARLTAWELAEAGVPHTIIVDNAAGHVMQRGLVDVVIVGTDRTSLNGDVANKIGTYQKALAARDNGLPFYAAVPSSSIDWASRDGVGRTPIEQRSAREVTHVRGSLDGRIVEVQVTADGAPVANFGFDVTPARLVTGLITERGICEASEDGILRLFPDRRRDAVAT